jgi:signal transduction histidine kinase
VKPIGSGEIEDAGCGIAEEIRDLALYFLFTTKEGGRRSRAGALHGARRRDPALRR